jgi:hypothetical protein
MTVAPDANILWISIQNGLTVICCCLPTYGSMLVHLNKGLMNLHNYVLDTFGSSQISRSRNRTKRQGNITEEGMVSENDSISLASRYWEVGSTLSGNAKTSVKALP